MGKSTTHEQSFTTFGHREDARLRIVFQVREINSRGYVWKYKFPKQTKPNTNNNNTYKTRKIYTRLKYANKNLGYYILPSLQEFRPEIQHNLKGKMRNKLK